MPTSPGASSTLIQPVGSQTRVSVLSKAGLALRKVFFTAKDLTDPDRLYQVVYTLQQNLARSLQAIGSNPTTDGNLLSGVVFSAPATTLVLSHGLGRAFVGFYVADSQGAAWSGFRVANPSGVTPAQCISIKSNNAGTYSFWVY